LENQPRINTMKNKLLCTILTALMAWTPVYAQPGPGRPAPVQKDQEKLLSQSFVDTPLEMLIDFYNDWEGRTLIINNTDLTKKITLKYSKLTKEEAMQAIESVLAMNGIGLVRMGDKFLKVVPIATGIQEGMVFDLFDPDKTYAAADQPIAEIIPLRYVVFSDVQPVIQSFVHSYGKIIQLERINSIMVVDSSANVARIVEILGLLDQPLEKIDPRIYQLNYAKASDIASKLKELVEASQTSSGAASKTQTAASSSKNSLPGVTRAPKTTATTVSTGGSSMDEGQMIQGDVKFVSDERTNILIVFSKKANFDFFDNIIKVLDVPVDSEEIVVETIALEYAEAADVAGVLNDFIGAAKADSDTATSTTGDGTETGTSRTIGDVIAQRSNNTDQNSSNRKADSNSNDAIGRLSEDTKIISDERTNSLLLMGSESDIATLKKVIASLDVFLQQVVIEAVILNIGLGDSLETGVEWVYDNGTDLTSRNKLTTGLSSLTTNALPVSVGSTALSLYSTFPSINLAAVISAAKTDSDSRILSTPIVMTTDNTEATITIADEEPVVTTSSSSSTYSTSSYEYKTIGIELTVTPHINPQGFVLMEITQSADDIGGYTTIDENEVPTIQARSISATVGVNNGETVVLGGLVRTSTSETTSKIPILGDIPLLGRLFSSKSETDDRDELVVLLTPYVLNTPEEVRTESKRRFDSTDSKTTEWPRGWSLSELANDEEDDTAWRRKQDKADEE
jgi:general secretion pathway protein D